MTKIAPEDPVVVEVDITGLGDFARQLRDAIDKDLLRQLADWTHAYNLGVAVGNGVESPSMLAARLHYQGCLKAIISQLNEFIRAGTIFADTAEAIARRYTDADALAGATVADLNSTVDTAWKSLFTPPGQLPSPATPRAQ